MKTISKRDHNLIVSALRTAFRKSDHREKVVSKAISIKKGPRGGKLYKCSSCGESFNAANIQVDHIKTIIPGNRDSYNLKLSTIIDRMWCPLTNLQVLCKSCHKEKTKKERRNRSAIRKKNKCK